MAELASRVRLARTTDPAEHEGEDKEGTPSREAAMPGAAEHASPNRRP